jgi:ABC-2 type transport system ATP-binding protein
VLEIFDLCKLFGNVLAVDHVRFTVAPGEIVGLLGPNGAGKTTTLRCVAGILQPTSGTIRIGGHDLRREPEKAKRELGFVPEVPNPYELLTVMEHVRFIAAAYDRGELLPEAEPLLRRLELWERRHDLAATLSKGMRQKLGCVCALIHRPAVLCFDEPMVGLDPRSARELKDLLAEHRSMGAAVLVSTHMLDTAERLCDRVVILDRGRFVLEGSLEQLKERASAGRDATLEDVFLALTQPETVA